MPRHHHIFEKIIGQAEDKPPATVAVVHPLSEVALTGAVEAAQEKLIVPLLIGPETEIKALAKSTKLEIEPYQIVNVDSDVEAAAKGVELCRTGKAGALMKGSLHTDHFMHAAMDDDLGLRTHRRISHVFVLDVPSYPHTLLITDAAVNIYPTLVDKADIVQNAIDLAKVIGIETPKVAILSAVETVTPSIKSTIDAAALCKMADRGQITGGVLDGPLAFDNAVNLKAAEIKHIHSPVAGRADILVVPDLEAGNMLAKQLEYLADAEAAGIVLGARVPIILTSRADSAKSRLASCAVAALLAHSGITGKAQASSDPAVAEHPVR
ncbi:MAG: bifunctional enoyl-CoA hydratase/phosphate acetyltransferase [Salaquimonas sp.]|nr:bifunctional enoyl-CoA hydratase/phosphate acetyltransferase [Salaquimonas sp.]